MLFHYGDHHCLDIDDLEASVPGKSGALNYSKAGSISYRYSMFLFALSFAISHI